MFTQNTTPYYQPSGRAPMSGLLIALVGGLLAAWIASFPYIYAVRYIPSIYICVFATIGYGVLVGWLTNKLILWAKIRSRPKAVVVAGIVALAAVYFQWVFFCALIFSDTSYPLTTAYVEHLYPVILLDSMGDIYNHGTWTLGKGSRTPVHGAFLGFVWLVEAGVIVVFALVFGASNTRKPFSESLNRWAKDETLPYNPPFFNDLAATKVTLESGDLSPVLHAEKATLPPCSEITFHTVEGDEECYFMTLSNLTIVPDKKGKESRKLKAIVEHLRITPAQHAQIRAKFGPTVK